MGTNHLDHIVRNLAIPRAGQEARYSCNCPSGNGLVALSASLKL